MSKQLLQDWVTTLELKDQAALIAILRGCDNESAELKLVTKMLRKLIVNDFNKMTNYTADKVFSMSTIHRNIMLGQFLNKHWYDHVKKAIFIVSDKHPELYTRSYWDAVYGEILSSERNDKEPQHVKRMRMEEIQLIDKINKLNRFISENPHSEDQLEQLYHMSKYYNILCKRLGFENDLGYCNEFNLYCDKKDAIINRAGALQKIVCSIESNDGINNTINESINVTNVTPVYPRLYDTINNTGDVEHLAEENVEIVDPDIITIKQEIKDFLSNDLKLEKATRTLFIKHVKTSKFYRVDTTLSTDGIDTDFKVDITDVAIKREYPIKSADENIIHSGIPCNLLCSDDFVVISIVENKDYLDAIPRWKITNDYGITYVDSTTPDTHHDKGLFIVLALAHDQKCYVIDYSTIH